MADNTKTEKATPVATQDGEYVDPPKTSPKSFRKKANPVDARQFTGGEKNAQALSEWIHENGFVPAWESRTVIYVDSENKLATAVEEKFSVEVDKRTGRRLGVTKDGWLVISEDGALDVHSPEQFNSLYEQA